MMKMRTYLRAHPLRVAFWLTILAMIVLRMAVLSETDIFWYIRSGDLWLSSSSPDFTPIETWDFSAAGKTWYPNSYLWNIVIALVWHAGGLYALSVFNGLTYGIAVWLTWRLLTRFVVVGYARYVLTGLVTITLFVYFTDRANTADILLLLIFVNVMLWLRAKTRLLPWAVGVTFLFAVLGQNLHLSGLIYVLLFPTFTVIVHNTRNLKQRILLFFITMVAAVAGLFVTPFGIQGIVKPVGVAAASHALILEWSSPSFANLPAGAALVILGLAVLLGLILLVEHRFFELAALVFLIVLTAEAIRFGMYVVILGVVIAALAATRMKPGKLRLDRLTRYTALVLGAVMLIGFASVTTISFTQPSRFYGVVAADFKYLPAHARVLSSPAMGSAIIFYRPDVQVAIDGRNDLLGARTYGQISDMYAYSSSAQFMVWADKNNVDAVFVGKSDTTVREKMLFVGWREYDTADGYTFVRTTVKAG